MKYLKNAFKGRGNGISLTKFKSPRLQKHTRSRKGSTLALIAAVTVGLVTALIFFFLNYARLLGSNAEQKKAIESAALTAATDVGNIVLNTSEFGYVSLSDQAPIGKGTTAGDLYYLPVRGINTLVGTARLDAIIADKMPNSGIMSKLAQNDLNNTKSVITKLNAVITASLTAAGSPKAIDRDGNPINVYLDAENAYKQNIIRMSGSASYVPNSLVMTLGSLQNPTETNIPVPVPTATAPVPANQQADGFYKSFMNIPYNAVDYVFGGIGSAVRLVDTRDFVTTVPGLAYQVPTIVKAEADEIIKTSQTPNGATFHVAACAQPASVFDPKPAPGALAIEFPDGALPEFTQPEDLMTFPGLNTGNSATTDIETSTNGDYLVDPASGMSTTPDPWPSNIAGPTMRSIWQCTLYDWIRRAGTKADIDQTLAMQTTKFGPSNPPTDWLAQLDPAINTITNITALLGAQKIPFGVMQLYKWNSSGGIVFKTMPISPYPYEVVSENQLYAEVDGNKEAYQSATLGTIPFLGLIIPSIDDKGKGKVKNLKGDVIFLDKIDVYIRDQCRNQGTISGGKHGGEPMDDTLVTVNPLRKGSPFGSDNPPGSDKLIGEGIGGDKGSGGYGCGPKGSGSPPLLSAQSDFGDPVPQIPPAPFVQYSKGSAPGATRPTYRTTGLCGSIRFRREVQVKGQIASVLGTVLYKDVGYIGQKPATPTKTYFTSDPTDVTDNFGDK
ncbi:MAG: hypothetical protein JST89_03310 [Cyanobacteria bacterium SZAS-4]|nr:hypothetical protein [Cyanobacteria bacterium SZAS-4]